MTSIKKNVGISVVVLLIIAFGVACKHKSQSPVVARVGQSILTIDNLYKSIPAEYSDFVTREQMINYVKQWIDNEILFQEALHQKLDKEDEIKERLRRMKQDLLCAEIINRNAGSPQNIQIEDEMIQRYYDENKKKFVRTKDAVRYIQIVVDDGASAWTVRGKVTADNFLNCASQYSKIPCPDPRTVPYASLEEIPPAISKEITALRVGGISNPIKTELGYHIIRVLDKQAKGSIRQLDEVREDIINILSTKTQNAAIERMLSGLRSKMVVEVHFDIVPSTQKNQVDTNSNPAESKIPQDSAIVN
jgi:peptidyl-prolyl cis-trans isomerase C